MASFNTSQSTQQSGLLQVSQLAMQHMEDMFSWAQTQFADTSALTDGVVNDMLGLYGQLSGIGNSLMGMYDQYFQPEYQQLVQDANTYSSAARISQAMGAAESDVSQSFGAQRQAALADLQSYGVDPSSGRYAALDNAERTQQAAAMAGAGFQAEQATEATGRALRSEALQLGSVMPSQATAAYNAGEGAATAAENAKLANVASGTRSMEAPAAYGNVAQQYRTGQSRSVGGSGGGGEGGGGSGGRGGSGSGGEGPRYVAPGYGPETSAQADPGWAGSGPPNAMDVELQREKFQSQQRERGGIGPGIEQVPDQSGSDPTQELIWGQNPTGQGGGGGTEGGGFMNTDNGGGNQGWGGVDMSAYAPQAYANDSSAVGGGGDTTDYGGQTLGGLDYSTGFGDTVPTGVDFSGGDGGGGDFKEGGMVPYDASPSHGRVTDDVRAKLNETGEDIRLNAGEFIMPRHTVRWKGEKFFQDLIRKSKEQRGAAGAKPSMKPALPAHKRFAAGGVTSGNVNNDPFAAQFRNDFLADTGDTLSSTPALSYGNYNVDPTVPFKGKRVQPNFGFKSNLGSNDTSGSGVI